MSKSKYTGVYQATREIKGENGEIIKEIIPNRWVLRMCYTVNSKTIRDTKTVEAKTQKQAYDIKVRLISESKELAETGANLSKSKNMTFNDLVKDLNETTSQG